MPPSAYLFLPRKSYWMGVEEVDFAFSSFLIYFLIPKKDSHNFLKKRDSIRLIFPVVLGYIHETWTRVETSLVGSFLKMLPPPFFTKNIVVHNWDSISMLANIKVFSWKFFPFFYLPL
jgi:hypothetical protein